MLMVLAENLFFFVNLLRFESLQEFFSFLISLLKFL